MAISYAGVTLIRPAGQTGGKPPLILRNPQDDDTKLDYQKCGPNAIMSFGPGDYRMYYEGLTDQTAGLTNYFMYATASSPWTWTKDAGPYAVAPNDSPDWEQGEVCPTCWWYEPSEGLFKLVYHGGNNAGPRQIGLMTSPRSADGAPGSWTRYGSAPILTVGPSDPEDEDVADATVIRVSASLYVMLYRGNRSSDTKSQICRATSTDRGYTWTRDVTNNPVLALGGSGANDETSVAAPWAYMDELGRFHMWYVGEDAAGPTMRLLYAFSDDNGESWTRNASQVILNTNPGGGGADPDLLIGDVVAGIIDEGLILINCMNFNFSAYTGDALGRLEGRGQYWMPCEAASQPTRPGRAFTTKTSNSRVAVNAAGKLLNSTVATIWTDFKIPPGNQYRTLYHEYGAFNKEIFLRINNVGLAELFWRTPTGIASITSSGTRYDDGLFHWVGVRRTATNAFDLVVDGTSVGTSSVTVGADNTTVGVYWGNFDVAVATDEPVRGILRQSVTIQGTALSIAQMNTLWNGGADGGTLPVTATCWVKHGSGGAAGPDAAYGGATYGTSVSAGTKLVNAGANGPIPPFVSARRSSTSMSISVGVA